MIVLALHPEGGAEHDQRTLQTGAVLEKGSKAQVSWLPLRGSFHRASDGQLHGWGLGVKLAKVGVDESKTR